MSDDRMVKKIYKWKPITTRLQGRPKSRWDDNVKQDICKMKVKNWTVCVQDSGKWRDVFEKVKLFNIRSCKAYRRRRFVINFKQVF
jgi:hypothetical protein